MNMRISLDQTDRDFSMIWCHAENLDVTDHYTAHEMTEGIDWSACRSCGESAVEYRRKGFTLGKVRVAGYIKLHGSGYTNVRPAAFPNREAIEAGQFEIIDPEFRLYHEED